MNEEIIECGLLSSLNACTREDAFHETISEMSISSLQKLLGNPYSTVLSLANEDSYIDISTSTNMDLTQENNKSNDQSEYEHAIHELMKINGGDKELAIDVYECSGRNLADAKRIFG